MQWLLEHAQLRNRNWLHEQATRTASQNVEAIILMAEKVCAATCRYCEPDSVRQPVDQEEEPLLVATGCREK
jgi:L-lysine 2,3-aminomutase